MSKAVFQPGPELWVDMWFLMPEYISTCVDGDTLLPHLAWLSFVCSLLGSICIDVLWLWMVVGWWVGDESDLGSWDSNFSGGYRPFRCLKSIMIVPSGFYRYLVHIWSLLLRGWRCEGFSSTPDLDGSQTPIWAQNFPTFFWIIYKYSSYLDRQWSLRPVPRFTNLHTKFELFWEVTHLAEINSSSNLNKYSFCNNLEIISQQQHVSIWKYHHHM